MSEFNLGQRWLSETETSLGLGIISQIDGRQITVFFPGNGETRIYASSDAPLARLKLSVGQQARHADNWLFTISDVKEQSGLLIYFGQRHDDGSEVMVPESQLSHHVDINPALTRLVAGNADRHDLYLLRNQASEFFANWQQSPVAGLLGARVGLLPHQVYVARSVADRYHPRVLLADEVGLGKTIEAGMIMQRRLLTGRNQRVLLVVPESLRNQWLVEMKRRFALTFSVFDEERAVQALTDGGNPFLSEQRIVVSSRFVEQGEWQSFLLEAEFDLLVVDEAHHIQPQSPGYQAIEQLCHNIADILLLTATPEQEGSEGHFQRLRLLDSNRFNDLQAFIEEQQRYRQLATEAEKLSGEGLDELLDQHGTGRVMFRNRRKHIGGFPQRHLHAYPLPEHFPESGEPWWLDDPRVHWLIDFLKEQKPNKTLLICQSPDQVLDLAEALRVLSGMQAAVFHEQMSLIERDRAAAFFASVEEGSPILMCSEIGSEGRNFQFVQQLVLFDLPQNPDLLEQRIGRLDRIGQQGDIHIHVPYLEHSDEALLLDWYHTGMNAFEQCNPVGRAVYDKFKDALDGTLSSADEVPAELIQATQAYHQQLLDEVESGRDRLQELNACRPRQAEQIISQIEADSDSDALYDFMTAFWDRFGVNAEVLDENRLFVKPSEHMRVPAIPGLDDEGMTVTVDRTTAQAFEDIEFLSWDHPHVQAAIELLTLEDFGSVCVARLQNKALPAGAWFLELDYVADVAAAPALAAQEFFPQQRLRILLDSQGRELSAKVPRDALTQQASFLDKKTARQIVKQLRDTARSFIEQQQSVAEQWVAGQATAAQEQAEQQLKKQKQRLLRLQERNPSVRDDEIDAVEQRQQLLQEALQQPTLSLYAIRILVNQP
ncbi:RNA polymerase-associated protein RapA [Idiomarina seosinensis]|uniref:RNA polymerase-associated protein RapA n=1 Tax=Idiomarina seosinensis TaxID=281739 RepID=UPI00384D2449